MAAGVVSRRPENYVVGAVLMTKGPITKILPVAAILLFCLSSTEPARADSVTTIPQFNGGTSCTDPCGPLPPVVVGTVDILAGDTSITLSGTFGNSVVSNTAAVNLYLGGVLVATCLESGLCGSSSTPTPWSDTLTLAQIATLGTGVVDFTEVQTSEFVVRLGATTIDQTSPVPEPSTWLLLGSGVLTFLGFVRKKAILRTYA